MLLTIIIPFIDLTENLWGRSHLQRDLNRVKGWSAGWFRTRTILVSVQRSHHSITARLIRNDYLINRFYRQVCTLKCIHVSLCLDGAKQFLQVCGNGRVDAGYRGCQAERLHHSCGFRRGTARYSPAVSGGEFWFPTSARDL